MEPITRGEKFLAAAAGEYSGELPAPITRQEQYLKKIIEEIDGGGSVSPEQIDAAIEDYINTHGSDIVSETELSQALSGYATTAALAGKVDKETGKSLMSADEHTKLNNIEAGAQVNTVTGVKGANEAEYRTGNISISKGNVGLGNVDNTADADKPISTATQTALAGKQNALTAGANITIETVNDALTISATDTTYSAATTSTAGLMSATDKTKLNACKKIVYLASEAAYKALNPPDPDTVYLILE